MTTGNKLKGILQQFAIQRMAFALLIIMSMSELFSWLVQSFAPNVLSVLFYLCVSAIGVALYLWEPK